MVTEDLQWSSITAIENRLYSDSEKVAVKSVFFCPIASSMERIHFFRKKKIYIDYLSLGSYTIVQCSFFNK